LLGFGVFFRILEKCLANYSISEPEILGQIYLEVGANYFQRLQLNRALDYYNKALILYEKLNWQHEIPGVLKKIALLYSIYGVFLHVLWTRVIQQRQDHCLLRFGIGAKADST
jgi:tetratricopeptide (TPR) repeat protein